MLIRNSLKQIFRTPVRTVMFFILLLLSTALLATGINLWQGSVKGVREFESLFHTIATVRQKESGTKIDEQWDAETKSFSYYRGSTYGKWIEPQVLDFDGAGYITSPRKRPYFEAYVPDYHLYTEEDEKLMSYTDWVIVVEFKALTSGTADPIEVEITDKFGGNEDMIGCRIKICDHNNPEPITLEKGKTYIMQLNGPYGGHGFGGDSVGYIYEYNITSGIISTQRTEDGTILSEEKEEDRFDEVTPGFYDTDRGKAWMTLAQSQEIADQILPVQPVDKTILLKAFFNKTAYIVSGRDITEQEYKDGEDVCLIPQNLADYNGWQAGDHIELPLHIANYAYAPVLEHLPQGGQRFTYASLNAEKKPYQVFDRDTYEIVGIYDVEGIQEDEVEGIARNEVIIPYNSVKNSWENNIADSRQMRHATTSFEIPNGEIDNFMAAWKKQGIDQLEINFYDKGYTQLKEGIKNRQVMAYIFLAGGGVMTLLILLFFCHLFIAKQERRTAIERSMGMTARQCTVSLLSSLMLIVLLGAAAGGATGFQVSRRVMAESAVETYYDDTFTNGYVQDEADSDDTVVSIQGDSEKGAAAAAVLVLVVSGGIAGFYMKRQLKREPLSLLSRAED